MIKILRKMKNTLFFNVSFNVSQNQHMHVLNHMARRFVSLHNTSAAWKIYFQSNLSNTSLSQMKFNRQVIKCFSVFGCSSPSLFSCFFCCCMWTCCSSKDKKYLTRNWNTKIKYSRIIESEILINLIKEKLLIEIFKVEEK